MPLGAFFRGRNGARNGSDTGRPEKVLDLTPVKDAYDCLPGYERRVRALTFPHDRISLGFLESDSVDDTWAGLGNMAAGLRKDFAAVTIHKKDFGYRLAPGYCRHAPEVQFDRRVVLAKSRNHLLFRALRDEDWVLWLDVDVIEYPADIIQRLIGAGKEIVHPNCVVDYQGPCFDLNAWRDQGRVTFDQLRGNGDLAELDAVGGTMLLIRADLHRDGLIFPPFRYGEGNSKIRNGVGELETEGLGIMAGDMGHQCWGLPSLEVLHGRW